jgi:hypothetical protein
VGRVRFPSPKGCGGFDGGLIGGGADVDDANNDVVPGAAPETALAGFEGGAMKIVVSINRTPGEPLPTPRQVRLAVGSAVKEAVELLARWDGSPWMTVVRELAGRRDA